MCCVHCLPAGALNFMVGEIPVGVAAAASVPPLVEPTLSAELKSTQLEHLLAIQHRLDDLRLGGESSATHSELGPIEQEVAALIDHLCTHHITELGSPWHIR